MDTMQSDASDSFSAQAHHEPNLTNCYSDDRRMAGAECDLAVESQRRIWRIASARFGRLPYFRSNPTRAID